MSHRPRASRRGARPTGRPSRRAFPGRSPRLASWRRTQWRRFASAATAFLGALLLVSATRPAPAPSDPVVIAVRDLRSGTVLRSDDLAVSTWPSALAPPGASTRIADLVGRRSGGPIAAGEAVTATRLLSAAAAEIPPGRVVTSLPGLDPAIVAWIDVGRTVDVLEPGTGNVLAHDAAIVVAPRPGRQPAETWSMADHDPADGTLVVTVTEAEARSIAAAAGDLDRPVVVVVHPRAAG